MSLGKFKGNNMLSSTQLLEWTQAKMLTTSRIGATTSFIDGRNAEWSNHSEDRLAVPYKAKNSIFLPYYPV